MTASTLETQLTIGVRVFSPVTKNLDSAKDLPALSELIAHTYALRLADHPFTGFIQRMAIAEVFDHFALICQQPIIPNQTHVIEHKHVRLTYAMITEVAV